MSKLSEGTPHGSFDGERGSFEQSKSSSRVAEIRRTYRDSSCPRSRENAKIHIRAPQSVGHESFSSRRAPPQDAPVGRGVRAHFRTPRDVYADDRGEGSRSEDLRHDPVQSPPFALFSSSRTTSTERKRRIQNPQPNKHHPTEDRSTGAMHETILLQEARIKSLEAENDVLRNQLNRLIEEMNASGIDASPSSFGDERETSGDPASRFVLGRRNFTDTSDDLFHYTPTPNSSGKKFVSELCQLMELDIGHHNLLSAIMDKHHYNRFDELDSDYP